MRGARSSIWRSRRSCSGRVIKGLTEAGLTKQPARVVVEKPFGHDLESARALAAEIHQYIDESQLYRIDHFLGKMGIGEILYLRFANSMFEPIWNRNYVSSVADHDGRELRGRGPRPLLRPGRRAARRGRQPPDAGGGRRGDGAARRRRRRTRSRTRCSRCSARCRRPIRPITCAASTTATGRSTAWRRTRRPRRTRRCGWRSTTGAGRACRSSSAPASACRSRRPSCGSCSAARRKLGFVELDAAAGAEPAGGQARSVDRHPAAGRRPARTRRSSPSRSRSTWSSPQEGGEGPTPYEVLLHAALIGDSKRFTRQDGVEECWRVMAPLLEQSAAGASVREGLVGSGGGRPGPGRLRPLASAVGGVMSRRPSRTSRSARQDARRRPADRGGQSGAATMPAERRGAVAVHADRRLRVPVRLPYGRAGGARRLDRLAVRPAV